MHLDCKVVPEGSKIKSEKNKKGKVTKGRGTGSKLAKAAHKCKGKHGKVYKTCFRAAMKKK